jgi:hypothetical protein
MRDAIIFLMGVAPGLVAGWMARDFKIYLGDELRVRRSMQDFKDKAEREVANQ